MLDGSSDNSANNNNNNRIVHTSPLMAEEEGEAKLGGDGNVASTSSRIDDMDEQSPLERLIARSTLEQQQQRQQYRGTTFGPYGTEGTSAFGMGGSEINSYDFGNSNNHNHNNDVTSTGGGGGDGLLVQQRQQQQLPPPKPSVLTLCAITGCILQVGFVWSSFLAPSWFDTHLLLSVSLRVIDRDTDQLLHSTSLSSLLSDLNGADEGGAAMFLMITALVVPCLFSVSGPVWTVQDRKEQDALMMMTTTTNNNDDSHSFSLASLARWRRERFAWYSPRGILEYVMRISLCIFFLLCIMDIGTSSVEMNNNNTRFILTNQIQGGLACYTVGMTCALVVIVLLRISETVFHDHCWNLLQQRQDGNNIHRRNAPPNQAFQLPWNILPSMQNLTTTAEAQEELEAPLLGFMDAGNNNTVAISPAATDPASITQHQQRQDGTNVSSMQIECEARQNSDGGIESNPGVPCWKRVVLYELAILSTVLWVPALFMPLFELSYGGIISDFMVEDTFSVRFWEFPAVLWQRGSAAGAQQWVLVVLGLILIFLVYVIPLLATLLAMACWVFDPIPAEYCRKVLGALQPCLCGVIFFLSLHFAIPSFEAIADYAIDMGSSGLCKRFQVITSDTCLTIHGEPNLGFWFLLVQSLSLEIFVILTLTWQR